MAHYIKSINFRVNFRVCVEAVKGTVVELPWTDFFTKSSIATKRRESLQRWQLLVAFLLLATLVEAFLTFVVADCW